MVVEDTKANVEANRTKLPLEGILLFLYMFIAEVLYALASQTLSILFIPYIF